MDKVIFHIDVNSAYLSWEAVRRKKIYGEETDLREIASVIGGDEDKRHGIVLAKSEKAKKFGIKTGESLAKARMKCRNLVIVPPDFSLYIKSSRQLISFLNTISPKVTQYSIDEAFVDMTGTQRLYGEPVSAAEYLRERIYEEFGFTVNIGISNNRLLAKMASDFEKPNRVHTLYPSEIEEKMWPLDVGNLFFVGRKTAEKLRYLGIKTIGDLANTNRDFLIRKFKKQGEVIHNHANGIETFDFEYDSVKNKGYGNSTTTPYDVTDRQTAKFFILSLSETVSFRLREHEMKIEVVSISLVYSDFQRASKQMTLRIPANTTNDIFRYSMFLFDKLWNGNPIRQIGVQTSKASRNKTVQLSFFDDIEKDEKIEKLDSTLDDIRKKFGEDSVKRACFVKSEISHMGGGISKDRKGGITGKKL